MRTTSQYRDFLKAATLCFDDMAELQRTFYLTLHEEVRLRIFPRKFKFKRPIAQVLVPLRDWRNGEYLLITEQVKRFEKIVARRKEKDIETQRFAMLLTSGHFEIPMPITKEARLV